jgi:sugar phosphate isomerase/epimerase
MYSRREFSKLSLLGAPLCFARAAVVLPVGVATFSFRDLPQTGGQDRVGRVIQALRAVGAARVELSSTDTESPEPISGLPKPQTGGAYGGMTVTLTPAELADIKRANRANLRHWRLSTQPLVYEAMRERFDAAGISVFSYRVDYDDAYTDDEIAATFEQAKALGAAVISSATSLSMARRVAPVAAKYQIAVALHNNDALGSPAALDGALATSRQFKIAFDIGNFTAANQQAMAYIQENHGSISHLLIKDRTRDGGGNEEFGNGDTPVKPVLRLLKEKQYGIPVFVQYEYLGVGTPEQEVKKCLAYVASALA